MTKPTEPFDPRSVLAPQRDRDLDELRESMTVLGWISEFPAIVDEYGVVIDGGRRLRIAEELGIAPVVRRMKFGSGDDADMERMRFMIAANTDRKPFTPTEKNRIAEYLYEDPEWSLERIGDALDVPVEKKDMRGRYKRSREKRKCIVCARSFDATRSDAVYCSATCRKRAQRAR